MRRKLSIRRKERTVREPALARRAAVLRHAGMDPLALAPTFLPLWGGTGA